MPSPEEVLGGLTAIANQARTLAIAWHIALGALVLALTAGWRPSNRLVAYLLVAPLTSVSALAWTAGNLFNGAVFALLALSLAVVVRWIPATPVRIAPVSFLALGAALVAFGWFYPHFLATDRFLDYAYAAPLGLLPCPTLSAVIGLTMLLNSLSSRVWSGILAAAGLFYGVIGAVVLGVSLDYVLVAGAAALAAAGFRTREVRSSTFEVRTSEFR